jgi:hypothetical protein
VVTIGNRTPNQSRIQSESERDLPGLESIDLAGLGVLTCRSIGIDGSSKTQVSWLELRCSGSSDCSSSLASIGGFQMQFKSINFPIQTENCSLPSSSYLQELGDCGRDGESSFVHRSNRLLTSVSVTEFSGLTLFLCLLTTKSDLSRHHSLTFAYQMALCAIAVFPLAISLVSLVSEEKKRKIWFLKGFCSMMMMIMMRMSQTIGETGTLRTSVTAKLIGKRWVSGECDSVVVLATVAKEKEEKEAEEQVEWLTSPLWSTFLWFDSFLAGNRSMTNHIETIANKRIGSRRRAKAEWGEDGGGPEKWKRAKWDDKEAYRFEKNEEDKADDDDEQMSVRSSKLHLKVSEKEIRGTRIMMRQRQTEKARIAKSRWSREAKKLTVTHEREREQESF